MTKVGASGRLHQVGAPPVDQPIRRVASSSISMTRAHLHLSFGLQTDTEARNQDKAAKRYLSTGSTTGCVSRFECRSSSTWSLDLAHLPIISVLLPLGTLFVLLFAPLLPALPSGPLTDFRITLSQGDTSRSNMKERVTFVHAQGVDVDPGLLKVDANQLDGPSVKAARENRLTVEVAELPPELAGLLHAYRDISIRWASPLTYDTVEPFTSRLSPGLHVFSTPASENTGHDQLRLCTSLQAFGSIDCMSAESFTTHGQGQSFSPPAATFHQELEDLSAFIDWVTKEICSKEDSVCRSRAEALSDAVSLDILWDSTLRTLRISSLFPLTEQSINVAGSSTRRTEVGVFSKDTPPNQKPHEIGVSGFLTVLGENKKPSGTLFGFPSRHRVADAYFSSDFVSPTGLHPTLRLTLSSNTPPPTEDECGLHAYFTLPRTIFADRYQFADQLFLASKNLTASRYTSLPVDLEAPAYTTKTWGSSVLLQLAPPSSNEPESWTAEVPLHLRYLEPSVSGKVDIEIPYPAVFWACEPGAHMDLSNNPFDRTRLGYDGLFSENTVFWHATPQPAAGDRIMTPISVPVLKEDGAWLVGFGTAAAVALGFAWVLWKLAAVFAVSGYGSLSSETQMESKKRK